MAKKNQLFVEHLEDVSGRVLDEYSSIIRDMIRGRFGIYALYKKVFSKPSGEYDGRRR